MNSTIQLQERGTPALSAGHGVSSDPAPSSALTASPFLPVEVVGGVHCSVDGSQPGTLTRADIQGAYYLLTGIPKPDGAVGAASVQVEGELGRSLVVRDIAHVPEHASEPFHEVGNLTHNSGKTARAYG